jgi:hypothetical protein
MGIDIMMVLCMFVAIFAAVGSAPDFMRLFLNENLS